MSNKRVFLRRFFNTDDAYLIIFCNKMLSIEIDYPLSCMI